MLCGFQLRETLLPVVCVIHRSYHRLAAAEAMDDGTSVTLEDLKEQLSPYSGRIVLRIPRSLHKSLKEAAQLEGVSLNQYMLYKLSL